MKFRLTIGAIGDLTIADKHSLKNSERDSSEESERERERESMCVAEPQSRMCTH